jgi:exopolysaccharide biosynthesis protein
MEVIMIYKGKRIMILVLIAVMLFYPINVVNADSSVIYETSNKQAITSGAILENIIRFTNDGWLNINVLKVDLANEYIKLDTITDSSSIKKLVSTPNLAKSRGAVAAVNASFFNPTGNGTGYPDGPIVESGKIISASSDYNLYGDTMASFSVDRLNKVIYNYWKTSIELITPDGESIPVAQYNKPSKVGYSDITVLDKKWGEYSVGASSAYPDIVEIVVNDGKVVEILKAQPSVAIPTNGFIIVSRNSSAALLEENFKVGDEIEMNITTTPDWSDMNMSVTGASILVKDGKIPAKFSFDIPSISKRNPRTMVGSSKNGKELIIATVDGRQNSSIGMTQAEAAQFMIEIGAYNALNLDGGGSTTMVSRPLGSTELKIANSPSDGIARSVSTAIGVFSVAPPSSLQGLSIQTEDTNVFVNTSRSFTVRGYDKYLNPVDVDPDSVKWSVKGVEGTFKGNVFHPESYGEGVITAKVGDVSESIAISVLSSPVQLQLSDKLVKLSLNQSKAFTVSGVNKNGYSAKINAEDVSWSAEGGIGRFDKNIFKATAKGTGYISASIGDTYAYCAVSVASDSSVVKDDFESINGTFLSYPAEVTGEYSLSSVQAKSGKYSGELKYSFSNTEETQAAYLVFSGNGIPLDSSASKIGVWVYNTHVNSNWLRAQIRDANGTTHMVTLSKTLNWTGWKYLEVPINDIKDPEGIARLYIAKVHPVADSGSIYFDDLTVSSNGYQAIDSSKIPQDTMPTDDANKSVQYKPSDDSFRFAVFGQSHESKNPFEKILNLKLAEKTDKYIDAAALVGTGADELSALINKPVLSTGSGYKSMDMNTSRFIQLDMSKQGLRQTDKSQWNWFLKQLDSFKGENVFILLSCSPDNFSDSLEAELFKNILTDYKKVTNRNIWVFYKGDENASFMYRGVKYISSAGLDAEGISPDNIDAAKYILVTVRNGVITYEIKPII